jgi:hypothetical protein
MNNRVRVSQDKAQALLQECKWLLTVYCYATLVFGVLRYIDYSRAATFLPAERVALYRIETVVALVWILSTLGYLVWLGRITHALGRSVIKWILGTWLVSIFLPILAYILVYFSIRREVRKAFAPAPGGPRVPT